MNIEKPELVNALATVLADSVVLSYKLQGAHWNVVGPDFSANHAFFQEIYEDVESSIDPVAEDMRKLGALAPSKLIQFAQLSNIQDSDVSNSFSELASDIHAANEIIIQDIDAAFQIATAMNEQGVADLLAGRDDMHKKWRWQLGASLNLEHGGE